MASYYVWSGAAGGGNGTTWVLAYQTLTTALSGKAAGDTFYVAHDHAETTAAQVNLFPAGTYLNPSKVICANRAGSVPPVSADRRTTAQVATSGDNIIRMGIGSAIYDGIIFIAGNGTGAATIEVQVSNANSTRFDNCSLRIGSTGTGRIMHNTANTACVFNNTTVSFSATTQGILVSNASLKWTNTPGALIGAQVPSTLFAPAGGSSAEVECIGVDFSAAGSGKTLIGTATGLFRYRFIDCKLNAAVTKAAPTSLSSPETDFLRSGSAGVNYAVSRHRHTGTLTEETTIVRSGGASDGTTPLAWKIVTTADAYYLLPFECPPIAFWNDTTGSAKTATIECIGTAIATDQEVWLDLEFLGDASSPLASFVNDGKVDLLATAANQTTSSATWGGALTGKFKINVTFTAQQKGWIYARVKCAKASSTFYIDPLITLT